VSFVMVSHPGTTIAHDCELADYATIGPSCALTGTSSWRRRGIGHWRPDDARGRIGRAAMIGAVRSASCLDCLANSRWSPG
jgi:hypothetical protein